MKDDLDIEIMSETVGLRVKCFSYLIDDGSNDKKNQRKKSASSKGKKKLNLKIIKLFRSNST